MSHSTRRSNPRAAKARDISRSALASTRRVGARSALTTVRRQHRHHMAAFLHEVAKRPCVCADEVDECPRCDSEPDIAVVYPLSDHLGAVSDRRSCDKLAPLLRWGRSCVGVDGPASGPVQLRAMLPVGPIGDHAMAHLTPTSAPTPMRSGLGEHLARTLRVRHGAMRAVAAFMPSARPPSNRGMSPICTPC